MSEIEPVPDTGEVLVEVLLLKTGSNPFSTFVDEENTIR